MTKIERYACDYCNRTFSDESDCVRHEWGHQCERVKDCLRFADSNGKEIAVEDLVDNGHWHTLYDEVYYAQYATIEAYHFLQAIDDKFGCYNNFPDYRKDDTLFYDDGGWHSVAEMLEEAQAEHKRITGIFQ